MASKWFWGILVIALILETGPGWANDHHKPPPDLPEGIVSVDTFSRSELEQMIEAGYRDEIHWEEAFGEFSDSSTLRTTTQWPSGKRSLPK